MLLFCNKTRQTKITIYFISMTVVYFFSYPLIHIPWPAVIFYIQFILTRRIDNFLYNLQFSSDVLAIIMVLVCIKNLDLYTKKFKFGQRSKVIPTYWFAPTQISQHLIGVIGMSFTNLIAQCLVIWLVLLKIHCPFNSLTCQTLVLTWDSSRTRSLEGTRIQRQEAFTWIIFLRKL